MSGGSSANNSWTILTPEETVAETLRPLAEGKEHHEESPTSAAGSEENQPAKGTESAKGLPVEDHPVSEEKTAKLSGDTSTDQPASVPAAIPDDPVPTSLDVSSSLVPDSDALSQSEGLPEGPAQSSPDPDSFSDSYTHITPSSDEAPASLLSTETLGGVELTQEKETLEQEGAQHPLNGEGLQQEGEESDLSPTDLGKQADSPVDSEVAEESTKTGEEGEPEVRRRRSLLAALERIGRTEEEEEREEDFQLPHREEDSGFSVNKCILGAVILLGLGTIFFSGVFMNLDEESDYGTRELKDAELPGKQEWLNPEVPPPPVDADNTELLNKLAKGSEQISVLQAQLQAQREELKVAKVHAAEGAKEQLRLEEVEKENSRLKKEMASLPVLQKENERMKRELESLPALQKELESLRATVTELKLSAAAEAPVKAATSPSSGQPEASTQGTAGSTEKQPRKPSDEQWEKKKDVKKDKKDMGERKEGEKSDWKEGEKREWKDIGKTEWKKGKYEQGKFDKEQGKFDKEKDKEGKQKRHSDETKQWKEKEWKKGKASRGDEGKPWKDREGKNERIEKSERKEWKEEKELKKARHEKVNEGKQWRGKEEKRDWRAGKEHGEKPKSREEWKGEKEWRKGKDGYKESGKEKWAKKDLKEKGEKKEWQKDDWKSKNSKDHGKEGKWKGERKPWEESKNHDKERKGKDERKQWNENERKSKNGKDDKDWKRKDERKQWEKKEEQGKRGGQKEKKDWNKDKSSSQKHKDEHKLNSNHLHEEEHVWGERKPPHTHRRPSLEQPEYWVRQRDRLQDNPKPAQLCDSLETCAQAEGLLPVPFPDFEAILQTYLAKAEEAGVDASKREELQKLAAEFFKDGLFVHDQMSFTDFVEDLADVLEDMVEGDESDEEDSDIEDEMEEFEKEVLKKFSVPGAGAKEERSKGERRKESGRGRG
ncbi:pre-B-cell leukemia homeobox interacting protein 1b isoform X1 [Acanthopagrus latus]|uniref:pre-B-cell leukemia homeobox interacting protein 1b isoform X1 n=1 Tax=Acanthopagrus latus TaxID=8177 RepID=UPI00187BE4F2|nr:pre-B-cell leukemia homeobox interacting protein 1b isoform X1 [Acanthopagrus latus]